ncbi:MAG: 50S ribosomal protein L4 [Campylobacterales bacterium]
MSKAIVLDATMKAVGEIALPEAFAQINAHNLYLYAKAYLANLRAGTAHTKTRGEVSGGGKKPWAQKGGGRARAGSITSPVFVGGGVSHGPRSNRNWTQKINKKQKRLALQYALNAKAAEGKLFVVDKISIPSGKTKDAAAFLKTLGQRDALLVASSIDEKSYLAFRNIQQCYLVESSELNAYLAAVYHAVVIEKDVLENLIKES